MNPFISYQEFCLLIEKQFHDKYTQKNKWYELSSNDANEFVLDFFKMIENSYKPVGGYSGINTVDDLKKEIKNDNLIFHCIDLDDDNDADAISFGKETNHGFKFIGMATDGEKKSKSEILNDRSTKLKLKTKHYYVEVSGKIAEIFIHKYNVPFINDEKIIRSVLKNKDIIWYGKHPTENNIWGNEINGWYGRIINSHEHTKIMLGNPKK